MRGVTTPKVDIVMGTGVRGREMLVVTEATRNAVPSVMSRHP